MLLTMRSMGNTHGTIAQQHAEDGRIDLSSDSALAREEQVTRMQRHLSALQNEQERLTRQIAELEQPEPAVLAEGYAPVGEVQHVRKQR